MAHQRAAVGLRWVNDEGAREVGDVCVCVAVAMAAAGPVSFWVAAFVSGCRCHELLAKSPNECNLEVVLNGCGSRGSRQPFFFWFLDCVRGSGAVGWQVSSIVLALTSSWTVGVLAAGTAKDGPWT